MNLLLAVVGGVNSPPTFAAGRRELTCTDGTFVRSTLERLEAAVGGVLGLFNGELEPFLRLAGKLGTCGERDVRHALTLVRVFGAAAGGGGLDLAALTTLFDGGAAHGAESLAERAQSALLNVAAATPAELFNRFDRDGTGSIEFHEFRELCKHMNLFLSKTEALKIFTKFDNQGNGQIDYDEFEGCFKLLQLEIVLLVLEDMGITREALAFGFTYGVFTLLLLFGFILVGIAAFTEASSFSSVINSLLPVLSGTALGASSGEMKRGMSHLEDAVTRVLKQIG